MLRTITLSNHISVQGVFVRTLQNGRVLVRVGQNLYEGLPVGATSA